MKTLISKIQYKNFETGEFVNAQERNYEETIQLIENFPWSTQRDNIVIGLTNPSITIEGQNKQFLKFAVYFNRKFVLYYCNNAQILFTKSFIDLKEGYPYIKKFFDQPFFDTSDFKKNSIWFQDSLKHFITQDFTYVLTKKRMYIFLLYSSGINFFLSIILIGIIFYKGINSMDFTSLILLLTMMFLVGGGLHLILFYRYYNYAKDKILIISKGNDYFYFGSIHQLLKYNKKDVLQYSTIKTRNARSLFSGFAIVEIEFKDGSVLKIPNLLVDYYSLEDKLFEYPRIDENKFPSQL